MFFIDKYRPTRKRDAIYHKNILKQLEEISNDESIPNLIFYGPSQSGKKTIVNMFLEMMYDESIYKMNKTEYTTVGSNGSSSIVEIQQSNFHIFIEPNNNNSDKYIVQDIIKEYAKRTPMNFFKKKKSFKIVLINNVQNLSYHAQTSLRRTMELYAKTCRFIMISSSLSKVIEPIQSRCHPIRIPAPSKIDIFKQLIIIADKENIKMNYYDYNKIYNNCGRNIKKCVWELENKKYNINDKLDLVKRINLVSDCILEGSLSNLLVIRTIMYGILITNFSGTNILQMIVDNLLKKLASDYHKYMIIHSAGVAEHRLINGRHDIHHLEKFIVDTFYILQKSNKKVLLNKNVKINKLDFKKEIQKIVIK